MHWNRCTQLRIIIFLPSFSFEQKQWNLHKISIMVTFYELNLECFSIVFLSIAPSRSFDRKLGFNSFM
jgi:hypothetical protein